MASARKTVTTLLKFSISFGILGFLFYQLGRDQETVAQIRATEKQWGLLVLAWWAIFLAAVITFKRWHLLASSLGLRFSYRDAMRLGFVGYLFNFLSLGVAGGDVVKIIFLVQEQAEKRTEAVATVILDRFIGLYSMMLVATVAMLTVNLDHPELRDPRLLEGFQMVGTAAVWLTVASTVGIGLIMLPGIMTNSFWDSSAQIPLVGSVIFRLISAVRTYRENKRVLFLAVLMGIGVHALLCVGIFLVARGLTGACPSLATHFAIIPIANVANAIPLPGGLGALELALDAVYNAVSPEEAIRRQGFIVALGYRVMTLFVAGFGIYFWIVGRKKMSGLVQQAKLEQSAQR